MRPERKRKARQLVPESQSPFENSFAVMMTQSTDLLRYHQVCKNARSLLDNPDRISDPSSASMILEIIRRFVADNPRREPTPREIAAAVDFWTDGEDGFSAELARRVVVRFTEKSFDAVKKAHLRYGKAGQKS